MKPNLIYLLPFLFLWVTPSIYGKASQAVAEKVLFQLYQKAGRADKPLPSLIISEENKKVAAYYPARHQIVLDEKAYLLCRSMGKDSLDALAFILAHELAHAFQPATGRQSTNFLVYGIQNPTSNSQEKAADIQGAFTAYLAGYRIESIIPIVLERIYKAYGLWGSIVPGYPSFEERRNSAREVLAMARRLIDVFEAGNYLAVLEYYELAIACHTFLLDYYQGRDLYNNLGVLHLLQALNYYDEPTGRFAHPLELEGLSLLRALERQRGEAGLTEVEKEKRSTLLQSGLAYFRQALERDGSYLPAIGNAACALNLLGQPEEAIAFLQRHQFRPGRPGNPENLQMAYGIGCALKEDRQRAEAGFRQLSRSDNALYALQAQYNLDALNGQGFSFNPPAPFQLPADIVRTGKSLKLADAGQQLPLLLQPETGISLIQLTSGSRSHFSFWDATGSIVSLIRQNVSAGTLPPIEIQEVSSPLSRQFFYNVIASPGGYYIRSDRDGLILKANREGAVEEIVRWVRHRRKE
ncbi:MAG: hypothetical protein H6573_07145 [Lewinellaceae bacterium]|nr:hypothetical protein [Phaeodactylibacter sp.]MCB9347278.1 hypothetical protein [Lewinellaceae bacterium]